VFLCRRARRRDCRGDEGRAGRSEPGGPRGRSPPLQANRLLALRIADQNALFADFDRILSGILDRAAASGELDRGLEDIEAEELEVTDQEVIRTDVSTGAETALVTFSLKVRREILVADPEAAK
jgi:hypothetical protein